MQNFSVLIVEDDKQQSEMLKIIVSSNGRFKVCGCASSYEEAIALLKKNRVDMAIIDIDLKGAKNGIDVINYISLNHKETFSLVYTIHSDSNILFEALRAGANGYLLKGTKVSELAESIEGICDGEVPISPMIARKILSAFHEMPPNTEHITEREKDILELVDRGYTHRQISDKLNISINTVYTHFKNVYHKLQVNSKEEAVNKAKRLSII